MFPLQERRGHHYLEAGDIAADRETVEHAVRTQPNILLITS